MRGFFNWKHYDAKNFGIPQKNIIYDDMFTNKKIKLFTSKIIQYFIKFMVRKVHGWKSYSKWKGPNH
jgi:hypothetical protein